MTTLEEEGGGTDGPAAGVIAGWNTHWLLDDAKFWLKFYAKKMDPDAVKKAAARLRTLEYAVLRLREEHAHHLAPGDAEHAIDLDEPTT